MEYNSILLYKKKKIRIAMGVVVYHEWNKID